MNGNVRCPVDIVKPARPALSSSQRIAITESVRKRKTITDPTKTPTANSATSPSQRQLQTPPLPNFTKPLLSLRKSEQPNSPPTKKFKSSRPRKPYQSPTTNIPATSMKLPALDLHAILRPFRDELINDMNVLHRQTTQILSSKIDHLRVENQQLREIVNNICFKLNITHSKTTDLTITT